MRRKSFENMPCPVARSLERVGDWWNILILREAFYGNTRFEQFSEVLGIAPSTLTRRLDDLVAGGLLERRQYSERPPRDEYVLTERGRDFRPVLLALVAWGNQHFSPDGAVIELVDAKTGEPVEPVLFDAVRKRPIQGGGVKIVAGPAASGRVKQRFAEGKVL